jgi:poly-gamma-glutamate synthesis protein (capsule biosynthesis protein)
MQRLRRHGTRRRPRSAGAPLPGLSALRRLAVVGLAVLAVGTVGITASSPLHGREAAWPAAFAPAGRPDRGEPDGGARAVPRELPGGVRPPGPRPGGTRPDGAAASHAPGATSVTLVATGEIDLSGTDDPRSGLARLRGYGTSADLALCRLATPLPDRPAAEKPAGGGATAAAALAGVGFDLCTTAADAPPGSAAGRRTSSALDGAGVDSSPPDPWGASAPDMVETVGGMRIAILSYLDTPALTAERVDRDASRARDEGADLVIVQLTWGRPGETTVTARQRALAGDLLTSPAVDLLLGTGSGYPQAIEQVAGRYVAYDLGTLIGPAGGGTLTGGDGTDRAAGGGPAGPADPAAGPGRDGLLLTVQVRRTGLGWTVAGLAYTPTWADPAGAACWPIADALADRGTPASIRHRLDASWHRVIAAVGALGSTDGVRVDRVPMDPPPSRPDLPQVDPTSPDQPTRDPTNPAKITSTMTVPDRTNPDPAARTTATRTTATRTTATRTTATRTTAAR